MFSTIKSRVISTFVGVLIISIVIAVFAGIVISNYYIENEIYGSSGVMYKVDSADELDNIANTDYFDQNRLSTRIHTRPPVASQSLRLIITTLVIVSLVLVIFGLFLFNFAYNTFIRNTININNDKINDFEQVKSLINDTEHKVEHGITDIERINSYVNHELKNSLAVLKSKKMNEQQFDHFIDEINVQIDDISALTTNRLDHTRTIDILLLAATTTDKYSNKEIKLEFDDGEFEVKGNATLLKRAFDNIIGNAYKYGADSVIVGVSNVGDSVVIKISNNGPQIAPGTLDKIFDYKYRTNTLNADGTGIGLALVSNIVELHKGGLYVESSEECTSFYISLRVLTNN